MLPKEIEPGPQTWLNMLVDLQTMEILFQTTGWDPRIEALIGRELR
jgi:hypothetical protein